MEELDTLEVKALLEDYQLARRRDHCSRADFAAGWRAAKLRFAQEPEAFGSTGSGIARARLKIAV
jgi:hypothetical protein